MMERADERAYSLCELLDRVLNTGVVATGEVVISVAGVDLIYLNLNLLLSSVETARLRRLDVGQEGP
ncbi:MAG: gas vesicle protein [Rhodoferax sp.]